MKKKDTIIVEKIDVDLNTLFNGDDIDMIHVYEWLLNGDGIEMPEEARRKIKNALRKEKMNKINKNE